jgi:hypothetical protein
MDVMQLAATVLTFFLHIEYFKYLQGVGRLIDLEKRLERGEKIDLDDIR